MATRGFLIRFIDIGLIVLFGFLMISDIEASTRVELAGAGDAGTEAPEPDDGRVLLVIDVRADGVFDVYERMTPAEAPTDSVPAVATRFTAGDVEALVVALRTLANVHRDSGRELVVIIEPHPFSEVQRTVDAMDAADRLGLTKSLRMDIEVGR